ncbi:MAG TPA: cupin domain-containing protein [Solirubrobacterales bacterium]|nr:cupin domain-containing protein [Solirubrobacterales bacterium]
MCRQIANPATGERIVFLRTAEDTDGELLEMDDFWADVDHRTPEHIHPAMEERWEVISGWVKFEIGGVERTVGPGDSIAAPPGTPHCARNVGEEPAQLRIQMRPALRWQEFVERLFALAASGQGDPRRMPDPDSLPALMREFRREVTPVPPG